MSQLRMSSRATNLGLLVLVLAGGVTGLGSFLSGDTGSRWILWAHSLAGFAIIPLLYWKRQIILRSIRRHGAGIWAIPSLLLLALLLASLALGILWSTIGLPALAGESALTLHAALSLALAMLLFPHARAGWPGLSPARPGRRALLKSVMFLGTATLLWRGSEVLSAGAGLSGAGRRFTGSRPAAAFSGNDFPSNNWLLDNPRPIERAAWRLSVAGTVSSPLLLALDDLEIPATV
ncbi:MAG TPA: hypothetical protein VK821_20660, partial [Dehalococcoidia bacterium]|nr:hypothetical protein [Dehalococcoidia bacterium]